MPSESPTVVYIPCAEHVATPEEAEPVAVSNEAGQVVLLVYSTMDRLYARWGAGHPWLALPASAVRALQESQGIDQVVLDAERSGDVAG